MEELAAQLQETAEKLDPAKLTGEELESYIKSRSGLVRNPPTYASGILQVTGNGTVNEGDLFESAGGIQFAAAATVEISSSGVHPLHYAGGGGELARRQRHHDAGADRGHRVGVQFGHAHRRI